MTNRDKPPHRPGKRWICRPWITVRGRRVYPRAGRVFCFWVDDK